MTTVYFVRHAEAEGNIFHRMHGHTDGPLTLKGLKQTEYLKERFLSVPVDAVWSSDLKRAVQTAQAISDPKGLPIHKDKRLREFDFGEVEDMPWGNAAFEYPGPIRAFHEEPSKMDFKRGEDFKTARDRMMNAVWDIVSQYPDKTVVIASHGASLRAMMTGFLGLEPDEFEQVPHCGNTAVSRFLFGDGRVSFDYIADNTHLPRELRSNIGKKWWEPGKNEFNDNVRFVCENPDKWKDEYIEWREDAWRNLYGDLDGVSGEAFWEEAAYMYVEDNSLLQRCYYWDEPIGVLQMSIERRRGEKMGHISFCYLKPEYRYKGMGAQLVGQAVSLTRARGLKKLQLLVSRYNTPALRLYERCGFVPVGERLGSHDMLIVMEKTL